MEGSAFFLDVFFGVVRKNKLQRTQFAPISLGRARTGLKNVCFGLLQEGRRDGAGRDGVISWRTIGEGDFAA